MEESPSEQTWRELVNLVGSDRAKALVHQPTVDDWVELHRQGTSAQASYLLFVLRDLDDYEDVHH